MALLKYLKRDIKKQSSSHELGLLPNPTGPLAQPIPSVAISMAHEEVMKAVHSVTLGKLAAH